jgi:hypothetical protein
LVYLELYLTISEHAEDFEANELTEFLDSDLRGEITEVLELFLTLPRFLCLGQGSEIQPYFGFVKTLFAFGCTQSCAISIDDFLSCMHSMNIIILPNNTQNIESVGVHAWTEDEAIL